MLEQNRTGSSDGENRMRNPLGGCALPSGRGAVSGSADEKQLRHRLPSAFNERVKRYRTEKTEFFAESDWPVRLAKECSEVLAAKPVAK